MRDSSPKTAGAFIRVALVFLSGLIGGGILNLYYRASIWSSLGFQLAGLVPLVVGIWLFAWARLSFRKHRTALMPWNPSTQLVQDGPYSFTRNPIYLAFVLMYLGLAFLLDSAYILVALAIVVVLFDRAQIPREERYLQEVFGEAFSSYKAKVRRWF